jgi:UDP-N-acetylmuramoylalanine--D-glutamate ligase
MSDEHLKYIVMGAARSGMAAVRLLHRFILPVILVDDKPASFFSTEVKELESLGVSFYLGEKIPEALWDEIQTVIVSPGVPLKHWLIEKAGRKRIPVIGELEFAFRFARAPITAVTGTNGKTTTVHLAADILQSGGIPSIPVGNVGFPLSQGVLDNTINHEKGCLVTEVSTFQLETIRDFHPRVAALLNITPDHLDRHGSMDAYRDLKYRITENQTSEDILIVNADDPLCLDLGKITRANCLTFSVRKKVERGAYLEAGALYLNLGKEVPFLTVEEIPIPGLHNIQNVLAAGLVGAAFGVEPGLIARAVKDFNGVEHRLEFVSRENGVRFYNDSKATNLDSMEKALLSFAEPIVLIAGGRDKGNDYQSLSSLVRDRVKFLVVMGESTPLIMKAWGHVCPAISAGSMNEAVRIAFNAACGGDVILFSPGCSSFDAFQNYEHRGKVYKEEVRNFLTMRN